jgi:hypothetical protein
MPINDNSPLRRLPERLDKRQRLFLEGIRYSTEMAELAYARLCATAEQATRAAVGKEEQGPPHAALFIDAWSIVDSIHRLRAILRRLHELQWSDSPQQFLDRTSAFHELRNQVQHLDKRLLGLASRNAPVWGYLTWVAGWPDRPNEGFLIWALGGAVVRREDFPAVPPGRPFTLPVDLVELTSRGKDFRRLTVSLTEGIGHVQSCISALERSLAPQFSNEPTLGADMLLVTHFRWDETTP